MLQRCSRLMESCVSDRRATDGDAFASQMDERDICQVLRYRGYGQGRAQDQASTRENEPNVAASDESSGEPLRAYSPLA